MELKNWKAKKLDEFTIRLTDPDGDAWLIYWVDKSDGFNHFIWKLAVDLCSNT